MSVETVSAPPTKPAAEAGVLEELQQQVLAAFHGRIAPVHTPATYRLGIVLVALVMMILPLIYVAIIGFVCYAVYYHAVNDVGMLAAGSGRGKLMVFVAYLAPMIAGPILILFMFKPLLSRRPPGPKSQSLDPAAEPLVFAFVNRVCESVGAPRPREINVDCQVNASAGFRRSWLSMLGNDLVLTIGMPLVAGLNTRQFAGVLAHEFGHFAQGAGMRLTYVIRSISHWFTRVVYERDEWDERLVNWSQGIDFRLGWVFYVTRFFVWITRRILWVLMVIGHGVSGYMLRQMEFDADRHEARLAGSDEFAATSRRIVALSIANRGAQSDLSDFYREGRLGDDFARLVVHNVNQFTPETYQKIGKLVDESRTGWFDTHPCDKDRIASAHREAAPGIFQLELPSTSLFRNFDAASQAMTLVYYRNVLGDGFQAATVKPLDELLARQQQEQAAFRALKRFFQNAYRVDRPLSLPETPVADAAALQLQIADSRTRMLDQLPQYQQDGKTLDETPHHERRPVAARLEPFEAAAAGRLSAGLQWLHQPAAAERVPAADDLRAECARLSPSLRKLGENLDQVLKLSEARNQLETLLQQMSKSGDDQNLITAVRRQMAETFDLVRGSRTMLVATPYPFDHARKETSMGDFVLDKLPGADNPVEIYYAAGNLLENFHRLRARVIGCLCAIAERAETAIGLEPLPDPQDQSAEAPESAPAPG
jgi:hypothetical protein